MIPKSLVGHNVPWATEEKLWITPLPAPTSPAPVCPDEIRPTPGLLTAPAPRPARRPVIHTFSPIGRGLLAGSVGWVVPVDPRQPGRGAGFDSDGHTGPPRR